MFWEAISHYLATNYHELDIGDNVDLMYSLYKANPRGKIQVNKDYLEGSDLHKERVFRRLSYEKIIGNIQNEIDTEIQELETSTAFTVLHIMKILYLSHVVKLDILASENDEEVLVLTLDEMISGYSGKKDEGMKDDTDIIDEYINNLNQFSKDFKLMHCFDLLSLIYSFKDSLGSKADLLKFIIYQTLDNIKDPEYYKGVTITYEHVTQLLECIKYFKIDEEELDDAIKITEFLLMKAISISDREIDLNKSESKQVVHSEGKLLKGSDESQTALLKLQLESLQQLSLILVEYDSLQKPSDKTLALLAFEADYTIKQTLAREPKDELSPIKTAQLPAELMNSYIQFQYLLART